MVRLSPKALRFAGAATRSALRRHLVAAPASLPMRLQELEARPVGAARYVEVPDDLGRLFLSVLDSHPEVSEDPNDSLFSAAIVESLRRELPTPA
jgi:hypothetical protein